MAYGESTYAEGVYAEGLPVSGAVSVTLGVAARTATALALTIVLPLGVAERTSTALNVTPQLPGQIVLGVAERTSTAFPVHPTTVALGIAIRAATALPLIEQIPLGLAARRAVALRVDARPGYSLAPYNRTAGRVREGGGSWTWEPPVAPIPAGLVAATAYDTAISFSPPTFTNGRPAVTVSTATKRRDRHRILVRNKDVTFFRDTVTPELDYQLVEPLLYGPATLRLPQVFAAFEEPGVGELSWLRRGAKVIQQRVDAAGNVTATDYKGVVIGFDVDGAELRVELGGEASGRAAIRDKQIPLYRVLEDAGRHAEKALRRLGLRFAPRFGPTTGIKMASWGGGTELDFIGRLVALTRTRAGAQWTIMPGGQGVYRMTRKDVTTVHATIYPHDDQLPASLRRDMAEEPNRVFGTGVTPAGLRVLGGVYPGLVQGDPPAYPFDDGRAFGEGTTNAQTDTGTGVTAMIHHLRIHGYIDSSDTPGGYDAEAAAAVSALQVDAGIADTGTMNRKTWAALYDLAATGYDMRGSKIVPLAQRAYTKPYRRTASGAIIGRHPDHDPHALVVDRTVDFGVGFTKPQMREWSRELLAGGEDNWVGEVTIPTGAVVAGNHVPGTPIAAADVMPAKALRPGMNVSLPLFMGGIIAHVSAVSVSGGVVSIVVDTQARDTLPAWEVVLRNRDSRRSPYRAWVRDHLSSGMVRDAVVEFSEAGGILGDDVELRAGEWRVFEVPVGRSGTVGRLRLRTTPSAEFCVAVFGQRVSEKKLTARIGNPLSAAGRAKWQDQAVRRELDRDHILLYAAGDGDAPCGYWPGEKSGASSIFTGEWQDESGFEYRTPDFGGNVLHVAVYANADTTIPAGRIMWPLLEPA